MVYFALDAGCVGGALINGMCLFGVGAAMAATTSSAKLDG